MDCGIFYLMLRFLFNLLLPTIVFVTATANELTDDCVGRLRQPSAYVSYDDLRMKQ